MRIAMIQDDWWPRTGGGPVHVKELSVALAEHFDHNIDIYTRALDHDSQRYTEREQFADGEVTVYRLGPCTEYWNPIGRVTSMFTPIPHLYRKDYDIIHGHTFLPAISTRLGKTLTDASTVFTVHGTAITSGVGRDKSRLADIKLRIERQLVLGFDYDQVISVNNEHVELLSEYHSNVTCIPNGVDTGRFSGDEERSEDIVFIGRLAPKKRVSDLIRAFAQIRSEFPESNLIVAGAGPEEENLIQLSSNLGVSDRVVFKGRISDDEVTELYASAGVFVLPSIWEGHPLTLLEAWASEAPVIASSVEGIKEFIDHRETGFLVPPRSPSKLAEALRYALKNTDEAQMWGKNGHKLVETKFSWKTVANNINRIYHKLV